MRGQNGTNIYTGLSTNEEVRINTSYAWSAQVATDLNNLKINNHDGPAEPLDAPPVTADGMMVYFRNIENELVKRIADADAILGCVAWLTSKAILNALAQKDPVSIIVQKEDFLRPDLNSKNGWTKELRRRYEALTCSWDRWDMDVWLSTFGDQSIEAVRCVGNYNRAKHPAFPRMHHKFIIFCKHVDRTWDDGPNEKGLSPYAVWTGSFNFTENAGRSLENALFITHPDITKAYRDEWKRIVSLSEPLDWESDWVAPEWRLGT